MKTEIHRHTPAAPWTYADLERRQRAVFEHVATGGEGALILSEVAPVITTGHRTVATDILSGTIPVLSVERGGLATYHGPGQWVLFAVERLDRLTGDARGVRKMVDALLGIALTVGREFEPACTLGEGAELGVWTPRGKFAAVGIKVRQGIVQHGLSINGYRTPESFRGLRPCGLDRPVDYLFASVPGPQATPTTVSRAALDSAFDQLGQTILTTALTKFGDQGYKRGTSPFYVGS